MQASTTIVIQKFSVGFGHSVWLHYASALAGLATSKMTYSRLVAIAFFMRTPLRLRERVFH